MLHHCSHLASGTCSLGLYARVGCVEGITDRCCDFSRRERQSWAFERIDEVTGHLTGRRVIEAHLSIRLLKKTNWQI